jgi:hypothetical protein
MRATFKLQQDVLTKIHRDLSRPHAFAAERVAFMACRLAATPRGICILAQDYLPVDDRYYEDDASVGAMMGSWAIRKALEYAFNCKAAMFHIHRHEHHGLPRFSPVDEREAARFVPDFWKVAPGLVHGALVLSHDCIHGQWWHPTARTPRPIDEYVTVGFPTITQRYLPL